HFWAALGSYRFHRADEAGGVAGGKELFGIVAGAAATTEFLRGRKLDVERAVGRGGGAVAAAGGCCGGLVEHFYGHGGLPWVAVACLTPVILHIIRLCTI